MGIGFGILKLITLFRLTNPKHFENKETEMFKHVKQGMKFLKYSPALLLLFMNETLVLVPIHVFNNFNQPLLNDAGVVVIFIAIIYIVNNILNTAILNNIDWLERNFTRKQLVNYTGIFTLAGFLMAAVYGMYWYIAVLAFFLIKTSNALRYPLFSQIKNDYIPSKSRSTTLSLLSMIDSAFDVIIFTSLGFIANIGLTAIFIGCSIVVFLGLLFPVKIRENRTNRTLN